MKRDSKRKSYRELKEDPFVKAPALAWFLDRKSVYISLTLVGCLAAGGCIFQGWNAYGQDVDTARQRR